MNYSVFRPVPSVKLLFSVPDRTLAMNNSFVLFAVPFCCYSLQHENHDGRR